MDDKVFYWINLVFTHLVLQDWNQGQNFTARYYSNFDGISEGLSSLFEELKWEPARESYQVEYNLCAQNIVNIAKENVRQLFKNKHSCEFPTDGVRIKRINNLNIFGRRPPERFFKQIFIELGSLASTLISLFTTQKKSSSTTPSVCSTL